MLKIFKTTTLLFCLFFISAVLAEIEIKPYRNYSWAKEWSSVLYRQLGEEKYQSLLSKDIDAADLAELGCPGLNNESDLEKKKVFWIVFLSALTRSESAFNPRAGSIAPKGGHGNYGLLQFSKRTAREKCELNDLHDIYNPTLHLQCGLKLLAWQLDGAPTKHGHFLRPDLRQQLFGKKIFLWGPLRQNDKRGRALLVGWFKKHLNQLPYCAQKT